METVGALVDGLEGIWDTRIASISNYYLGFLSSLLKAKFKTTQGLQEKKRYIWIH